MGSEEFTRTESAEQRALAATVEESGDGPPKTPASASSPTPGGPREQRQPGERIDRYIVLSVLGSGGMGVVYAAYDPKLDRRVALKVLHGSRSADEVSALRLLAEARALAKVSHPNVVAVHDVGNVGDEVHIGMELVVGTTLGAWRRQAQRAWPEVIEIFTQVADALVAIHAAGLVHRDVKPENVLIDRAGRVRVTDFGLARPPTEPRVGTEERSPLETAAAPARLDLTRTGARLGTPAYMAPEQWEGRPADDKSDQFSFCVALWECLFGERPFAGATIPELITAVTSGKRREPAPGQGKSGTVPPWVRAIVERGLAREPAARFPAMQVLADALRAGDPRVRTRRVLAAATAVACSLGVVAGLVAQRQIAHARAVAACDALAQTLRWDEGRAEALRAHLAGFDVPDAATNADKVVAKLSEHAAQWRTTSVDVCTQSSVMHTLPHSLSTRAEACLDRARSGFHGTVDAVFEDDPSVASRALRSVDTLTDLTRCTDEAKLLRVPPAPRNPLVAALSAGIRRELARTSVDEHVGTYARGLATASAALARARAIEVPATTALAEYRVAVFQEKLGSYEEAAEGWRRAYRWAVLASWDELASDAASALGFCEGYKLARYDVGLRWLELSAIHLERIGEVAPLSEANRLDVMAVLTEMKGDPARAVEIHRQAIAMRRRAAGDQHSSVGYGLANLAGAEQTLGRLEDARTHLLEAKAIFEAHFGVDNPTTAHVYKNLAAVEAALGDDAAAEALLRKVLDVWSANLGPDHADVGDVHGLLAERAARLGRLPEALASAARAHAIAMATQAAGHPDRTRSAARWARLSAESGDPKAARALLDVALNEPIEPREDASAARAGALLVYAELESLEGDWPAACQRWAAARALLAADAEVSRETALRAEVGRVACLDAEARAPTRALAPTRAADPDREAPDDPVQTLRARLDAVGADMDRGVIAFGRWVVGRAWISPRPADAALELEQAAKAAAGRGDLGRLTRRIAADRDALAPRTR